MKIISATKYLQVEAIWFHAFSYFVDLFRLLRLSSALTEYNVGHYVEVRLFIEHIPFGSYQTCFFGML